MEAGSRERPRARQFPRGPVGSALSCPDGREDGGSENVPVDRAVTGIEPCPEGPAGRSALPGGGVVYHVRGGPVAPGLRLEREDRQAGHEGLRGA